MKKKEAVEVKSSNYRKSVIEVTLSGLSDIMMDRFIDHSAEKRPVEQKLYLDEANRICLPAENIWSFLFSENNMGCAKSMEGKQGKKYIKVGMSHMNIEPQLIPFRDTADKEIYYEGMKGQLYQYLASAVTKKGALMIKQEAKPRPCIKYPWRLSFTITLIESEANDILNETKLYNWFVKGGLLVALGSYRPRFGRFEVIKWDVKEI